LRYISNPSMRRVTACWLCKFRQKHRRRPADMLTIVTLAPLKEPAVAGCRASPRLSPLPRAPVGPRSERNRGARRDDTSGVLDIADVVIDQRPVDVWVEPRGSIAVPRMAGIGALPPFAGTGAKDPCHPSEPRTAGGCFGSIASFQAQFELSARSHGAEQPGSATRPRFLECCALSTSRQRSA